MYDIDIVQAFYSMLFTHVKFANKVATIRAKLQINAEGYKLTLKHNLRDLAVYDLWGCVISIISKSLKR